MTSRRAARCAGPRPVVCARWWRTWPTGLDVVDATTVAVRATRPLTGWPVDDRPASAVVLAMPDPQAHRLLGDDLRAELPAAASFEPVLALVAGWAERCWDFDGLFVNDHESLAWVADDGRRRGDDAPVLVGAHHRGVRGRPPGRPGRRWSRAQRPHCRRWWKRRSRSAPWCTAGRSPGRPRAGRNRTRSPSRSRAVRRRLGREAPGRGRLPVRTSPGRGPARSLTHVGPGPETSGCVLRFGNLPRW